MLLSMRANTKHVKNGESTNDERVYRLSIQSGSEKVSHQIHGGAEISGVNIAGVDIAAPSSKGGHRGSGHRGSGHCGSDW